MSREALEAAAPRLLIRSARLVAAIGALALASTGEMSPVVLAGFLLLYFIGTRVARMPRVERVMARFQPFLAAGIFGLAVFDFTRVSQSFLLAVAHFLLGLQAVRLLALRTTRENLGSVLVSSLTVLSAATLAVDWTFFVLLVLFLPAVVWTLMLHTIVLESQDARDRRAGQAALGEGSPAWKQLASALRRSAGAAFLVTAACCALVFAAFPRFNLQGFRGQFLQPVHATGFTNQVELGKTGKIFTDDSVVMRVEIDPADRSAWTGYVRGSVLDEFDGRTWRRAPRPSDRLFPTGWREFRIGHAPAARQLKQSIYLESMESPILFAAPRLVHVKIDRAFLEVSPDGTVQRPHGDAWRIHYEAISAVGSDAAQDGRQPSITRGEWRMCTSIDEHIASARRLAESEGGRGTPSEIANRLAGHLSDNYRYTLTLPPPEGRHPIDNFLEHSREGHCEYFASALCLMLRYRGIPARIVTGFLSHEWNDQGNYYVVRMRDAHAWVEYYDASRGWVEIDPSPREAEAGPTAASAFRRRMQQGWDYLNLRWNRYILSYDIERQVAFLRTVTNRSGRLSARLERSVIDLRRYFRFGGWRRPREQAGVPARTDFDARPFIGPVLGISFLAAGVFLWRRRRRERVWFYPRLVKFLSRAGVPVSPERTLREMVAAARPALGSAGPHVEFLENEYYRIRFDPAYRAGPGDRRRARQSLEALKK